MVTLHRPTTEVVVVEWIRLIEGAGSLFGVATTLPDPSVTPWPGGAFATVAVIPMTANVDVSQRVNGYAQIDAWATRDAPRDASLRPPWGRAGQIVEAIREATDEQQPFGATLDLSHIGYRSPRVEAAWIAEDAEKITDDPSAYARFRLDLRLDWITPARVDQGAASAAQHTTTEGEAGP